MTIRADYTMPTRKKSRSKTPSKREEASPSKGISNNYSASCTSSGHELSPVKTTARDRTTTAKNDINLNKNSTSTSTSKNKKMAKSPSSVKTATAKELKPVLDDYDNESDNSDPETTKPKIPANLKGEYMNIAILLLLYTLQGIPMGFASTIPLIMKERGVSYKLIGMFSLSSWPFSLKILWAPFVDSCYSDRIGRRKTWLIPTQLLIGIILVCLSSVFDFWTAGAGRFAGDASTSSAKPEDVGDIKMVELTAAFFSLFFLCATQDIAVDGWALTILREENVGYQSTCNGAGQTLGYAFSFIGALSFQHFRLLQFDDFMYYCGLAFILVTCFVGVFKKEKPVTADEECESCLEVYKQLAGMWKLRTIRTLLGILFFWKAPWVACEAITTLKMQEKGIPKEHIAYIGAGCTVLSIFVPLMLASLTSGHRPLNVNMKLYVPRILMCGVAMLMVYFCPKIDLSSGQDFPSNFYFAIIGTSVIGVFISTGFFIAQMSYFAKVSPKDIGGTYMTLLNTFANLGAMWVSPLAFWAVDQFTISEPDTACIEQHGEDAKDATSGKPMCQPIITVDGFYIVCSVSAILGLVFFPLLNRTVQRLMDHDKKEWKIGFGDVSSPSHKKLKS